MLRYRLMGICSPFPLQSLSRFHHSVRHVSYLMLYSPDSYLSQKGRQPKIATLMHECCLPQVEPQAEFQYFLTNFLNFALMKMRTFNGGGLCPYQLIKFCSSIFFKLDRGVISIKKIFLDGLGLEWIEWSGVGGGGTLTSIGGLRN